MYGVTGVRRDPSSWCPTASPAAPLSLLARAAAFSSGRQRQREDAPPPELLDPPAPPRGQRALMVVVLGFAALAALAMVFAPRLDLMYALASGRPTHLGDLHRTTPIMLDRRVP